MGLALKAIMGADYQLCDHVGIILTCCAYERQRIASDTEPVPLLSRNLQVMIFTLGETPATPSKLFVLAPTIPAR